MTGSTVHPAVGGPGWSPRRKTLRQEIGELWAPCGVDNEWGRLEAILLHRPGAELEAVRDPGTALMLERPDPDAAARQHDRLASAFRDASVDVHYVQPLAEPPPNLMFVADLLFMTPEGAVVGRPASTVRAGEERWVARRLAELGIPVLRTVAGHGAFEGADAMWVDRRTVLLGHGLRTNESGATQVAATLAELGVRVVHLRVPDGAMHLMGQIRIVDRDLAFVLADGVDARAVDAFAATGYQVHPWPEDPEVHRGSAHNIVTLGPRHILMPADRPRIRDFYESHGVHCETVPVDEILKAAGGIGCLTGVLRRAVS